MTEKLLSTETRVSRQEAASKLKDMAGKLSEGRLEIKSGEESIVLEPSDSIEFEIEVERESDGDMSLEIELEWSEDSGNQEVEFS